ncbi:hypothetical protein KKI17_02030 [Patescibacteria group bacterium]|nr:hypothetical protein [Patescibacteria group bacterium]
MDSSLLRTVEKETKQLFDFLEQGADVRASEHEEGVAVAVQLQEPQLFIGEKGQTLHELQHLLRMMLKKKTGEFLPLYLDINNYQKNRDQYLRELARTTADEVSLLKREDELPPMSPAERRIVHMELAERQDVVSESKGEGAERRVVIKLSREGL